MGIEHFIDAFSKLSPLIAVAIIFVSHGSYVTHSEFMESQNKIMWRLDKVEKIVQKISGEKIDQYNKQQKTSEYRFDWLNK